MNNVVPIQSSGVPDLSARQIELVKRTVAADCNADEFNLFVEVARRVRLDPFRKQITPLVFSKNDPKKRRMSIIIGIDGQRILAQRCGNYRPAEEPTDYITDAALKGPLNPDGIDIARVRLWQQDNLGAWHPVSGEAYWKEFAPLKEIWASGEDGKRSPTGRYTLDDTGNWYRMPRVMISKCATMQALRAGWPDQFDGLYAPEEMDRARLADIDASEIAEEAASQRRLEAVAGNGRTLIVDWLADGQPLVRVPVGQFADQVVELIRKAPEKAAIFRDRNRLALQEFWAAAPGDALELKKAIEKAEAASRNVLAAG